MADDRPRIPTRDVVMVNPDGSEGFCLFIACTLGMIARNRQNAQDRAGQLRKNSAEVQAVLDACIEQLGVDFHDHDDQDYRLRLRLDGAPMGLIEDLEERNRRLREIAAQTTRAMGGGGRGSRGIRDEEGNWR